MGVNSGLREKKLMVPAEPRRDAESKTSIEQKPEEKSEVEPSQTRPKSSPEPQIKRIGRIPRLRPKTAVPQVSSTHSSPKEDRTKTSKKTAEKSPAEKSNLSLPPKKNDVNNDRSARDTSRIRYNRGKVESNTATRTLPRLQSSNARAKTSSVERSNESKASNEAKTESSGAANVTSKLKDPRKKRTESPKTSSEANPPAISAKKTAQEPPKTSPGVKNRHQSNEQLMKKNMNEKVKEALKEEFSALSPVYEKDMKKMTDAWVNSIYGSLTMRSHLVKLLEEAFPNINTAQFQTEDDRLLKCIAQAKSYTETETENLVQFVKSLMKSQNSAKEETENVMEEKEIAKQYSNDWNSMTKKLAEVADETKKLQLAIPEEERKKGMYEKKMRDKIREAESGLVKKEEDINKLYKQFNTLKHKIAFQGNIASKLENLKNLKKADIESLKKMEPDYQEIKTSYAEDSETYKKKMDVLQNMLEERKKVLEKEKEMKKQLQYILQDLYSQHQRLRKTIGSGQVEYIMQQPSVKDKNREQLWVAAVKLVLRGFLAQMKKLECDKNKMLLELQSNDLENFKNAAAAIVRKDHFMKSIVSQMLDFHKSCNAVKMVENGENAPV